MIVATGPVGLDEQVVVRGHERGYLQLGRRAADAVVGELPDRRPDALRLDVEEAERAELRVEVVRVRRRARVDAQRRPDEVDALDVAVPVHEHVDVGVPNRRSFQRSTVKFGGISGIGTSWVSPTRTPARSSSHECRRRSSSGAIGRPAEPSSPLPRADHSGATAASWSSTCSSWMSPPWRMQSTPSNTVKTCGHSSERASGMWVSEMRPTRRLDRAGERGAVRLEHDAVEHVGAGHRGHARTLGARPAAAGSQGTDAAGGNIGRIAPIASRRTR